MNASAGTMTQGETGRLRPLVPADAPAIQRLAADKDVSRFTANIPHPYPEGAAADFLARAEGLERQGEGRVFAIAGRDGALIGCAGFETHEDGAIHLGYWLGSAWWGAGIMTGIVADLVTAAREAFPRRDLAALVCVDNPASARVLEKNGFEARGEAVCKAPARCADLAAIRYVLPAGGAS
ncbi:MAG: GNAT family N-acetyltransferase [Flavobacteriaceae bacterium]